MRNFGKITEENIRGKGEWNTIKNENKKKDKIIEHVEEIKRKTD